MSINPRPRGHHQQAMDLETALDECQIAAQKGFRIALDGLDATDDAIKQVSQKALIQAVFHDPLDGD